MAKQELVLPILENPLDIKGTRNLLSKEGLESFYNDLASIMGKPVNGNECVLGLVAEIRSGGKFVKFLQEKGLGYVATLEEFYKLAGGDPIKTHEQFTGLARNLLTMTELRVSLGEAYQEFGLRDPIKTWQAWKKPKQLLPQLGTFIDAGITALDILEKTHVPALQKVLCQTKNSKTLNENLGARVNTMIEKLEESRQRAKELAKKLAGKQQKAQEKAYALTPEDLAKDFHEAQKAVEEAVEAYFKQGDSDVTAEAAAHQAIEAMTSQLLHAEAVPGVLAQLAITVLGPLYYNRKIASLAVEASAQVIIAALRAALEVSSDRENQELLRVAKRLSEFGLPPYYDNQRLLGR